MNDCTYTFEIPGTGKCCMAYSKSKRKDGLHWANYPECKRENCPLVSPELLKGAILEGSNENEKNN